MTPHRMSEEPFKPDLVSVMVGTNDAAVSTSLAAYSAAVIDIVRRLRAADIVPVWCTVPPRSGDVGAGALNLKTRVQTYNAWLREWCPANGVPLVDTYSLLVDPATGGIKAAYDFGEHIHFTTEGYKAVGELIGQTLLKLATSAISYLACDVADPLDVLGGVGLFSGALTSGRAAGWSTSDGAHATFSVADGDYGKVQSVTALGSAAYQVGITRFINSTFFAPGDVLELSGRLSNTQAAGHTAALDVTLTDADSAGGTKMTRFAVNTTRTVSKGSFNRRFTILPGTTSVLLKLLAGPTAGTASFERLRVRNLTRLGLA